ncbi:winged helix-turn-helix domain-containing protein [Plantactinospora siamensis]|uniref:Winged helix-turn-helix domain-containing protein n=1 Tax=Plantactinospora siamensis TaxID=555372 RepID=A0ABV6NRR3_9ACTN
MTGDAATTGDPGMTGDAATTGDPGMAEVAGPAGGPPELDPVIHAQARLRVVATLATLHEGDRLPFPRLQELLQMTAGNLSVHLRKLEDARYVTVEKTHRGRTPTTLVSLSRRGRLAFEEYTAAVRALLDPGTPR